MFFLPSIFRVNLRSSAANFTGNHTQPNFARATIFLLGKKKQQTLQKPRKTNLFAYANSFFSHSNNQQSNYWRS
jgi:hypothetical protein